MSELYENHPQIKAMAQESREVREKQPPLSLKEAQDQTPAKTPRISMKASSDKSEN